MKRKVKTIKGVIGAVRAVADIDYDHVRRFDELSDAQKMTLMFLVGEAYNFIGELEMLTPPVSGTKTE